MSPAFTDGSGSAGLRPRPLGHLALAPATEPPPRPARPCPWGSDAAGTVCVVERIDGVILGGRMVRLDADRGELVFRELSRPVETVLCLDQLRMVTLTAGLPPTPREASLYRSPDSMQTVLEVYALGFKGGREVRGATMGHVETTLGYFLARPTHHQGSVVRMFVPRGACHTVEFQADRRSRPPRRAQPDLPGPAWWGPVREVQQLRLALQSQASKPLRRLGETLVEMGLVSAQQLQGVLDQQPDMSGLRIGERLVAAGCLNAEDLRTALRCKMGYPLLDVRRFPIDAGLLRQLPLVRALSLQALPIIQLDQGLVVVMADPEDQQAMTELRFLFQTPVIPVLPWGEVMEVLVSATYARHRLVDR